MKQINFESSNYNHKEELQTFLSSFNELVDKYNKNFDNRNAALNRIKADITRKKNSIDKLETSGIELAKREEELKSLKESATSDIKELEAKKKTIDYTDSEVMKMEKEDIDTLIGSKKNKINKIDAKMEVTRTKLTENKDSKEVCVSELKALEDKKLAEEDSLFKTQAILKLTEDVRENLNNNVYDILKGSYKKEEEKVEETKKEDVKESLEPEVKIEEEKIEEVIPENDDVVIDYNNIEETEDIIEEPTNDIEPNIISENEIEVTNQESLSMLKYDDIELPSDDIPSNETLDSEHTLIPDAFQKENINFQEFDESTKIKLMENVDRVLRNMEVLKKHHVPLDLTLKQPKVYYEIETQDLNDLLNIITTDDEGNGMGYTIDYVYYILDDLVKVNIDRLIDVYNNEFMNVNSKFGLIKLLKMANNNLVEFKHNREVNLDTLKSMGIVNISEIQDKYKEFIDLDNPLFLNVLNLFDKNDLVSKINADAKIIPKIMEYWLNN